MEITFYANELIVNQFKICKACHDPLDWEEFKITASATDCKWGHAY